MRWVILDAMGVVFEAADDVEALLIPFLHERDPSLTPEQIRHTYHRASLGEITAAEFWTEVGLGDAYPAIQHEYLDSRLTLDPGCKPAMEQLRKHYTLAMLSNDVGEWSAHLRKRHGLDALIETAVISGDVGMRKPSGGVIDTAVISGDAGVRKPDGGIYECFLTRTGASPADCVFVDDRERNLDAAATCGLHTLHFIRDPETHIPTTHARVRSFAELADAVAGVFRDC